MAPGAVWLLDDRLPVSQVTLLELGLWRHSSSRPRGQILKTLG